ncbi:MAG: sulfite reductase subunit alpha [Porticoccaceae bacterium]
MTGGEKALWTLVTVLAWAVLCLWSYRHLLFNSQPREGVVAGGGEAPFVLVAYASQSGTAEQLARESAGILGAHLPVRLMALNQVDDRVLSGARRALFVASTYGEGEPPDNGLAFQRRYLHGAAALDLSHLEFAVLALGDRAYQRFCGFGRSLQAGMERLGASPMWELMESGNDELWAAEGNVVDWQTRLRGFLPVAGGEGVAGAAQGAGFTSWVLADRRHLNPGSPGGPAFYLRLTAQGEPLSWRAGDIAVIQPATDGGGQASLREYSIASVPEEGAIHLLVRQQIDAEGRLGLGSGWLTAGATVGAAISLRIRRNPGFQVAETACPLILVGSGTGLAGLRAHLRARELGGATGRNWLLFGERTRRCDSFLDDEIRNWCDSGLLTRVDRVFSRDGEPLRYVQEALEAAADEVRRWVDDGAVICVCGSLTGMGAGVQAALESVLGSTRVEQLKIDGRYRRDLY